MRWKVSHNKKAKTFTDFNISIAALKKWEYPERPVCVYDDISNDEVREQLNNNDFSQVNEIEGWENYTEDHSTSADNPYHAYRVAYIVYKYKNGIVFPNLSMEITQESKKMYEVEMTAIGRKRT